jgi:murein L,D-transpeptidase YafK
MIGDWDLTARFPRIPEIMATRRTAPIVLSLILGCAAARAPAPTVPPPLETPDAGAARAAPDRPCLRIVRIEVSKGERRLRAVCDGGSIVTMTAALGRDPAGPKLAVGDLRTPEGHYRITQPARPSRFHRFLSIDYPSMQDAEAALADGRIPVSDYIAIVQAHELGAEPPQDTPLGGGLGLHGEGPRWHGDSADLDWTFGCVAVSDEELDFLAERAPVGTPVVISP